MATVGANITSAAPAQASSAPIVVWVDAARVPQVKAYEKANPSVKIDLVTFDGGDNGSGSIESKVSLFNRVGHGWPDIVFSGEANDVQKLGLPPFNFPEVLNQGGLLPNGLLKGYAAGTLADCYIGGKLECLRNDVAFDVLWVNVALMKQFGYTVPTTWQQWQAIGEDVAKNHPGYIVGSIGDDFDHEIYLQAAQCQMNDEIKPYTILDNPADPNCTGMACLLDPLQADGALSPSYVFASTYGKQYGVSSSFPNGHVLMMPGPAWYSGAIFCGTCELGELKGLSPHTHPCAGRAAPRPIRATWAVAFGSCRLTPRTPRPSRRCWSDWPLRLCRRTCHRVTRATSRLRNRGSPCKTPAGFGPLLWRRPSPQRLPRSGAAGPRLLGTRSAYGPTPSCRT